MKNILDPLLAALSREDAADVAALVGKWPTQDRELMELVQDNLAELQELMQTCSTADAVVSGSSVAQHTMAQPSDGAIAFSASQFEFN